LINGEVVSLVPFCNNFCAHANWLWIPRSPRSMNCDNIIIGGCFKGHLIVIVGHRILVKDSLQNWRMALANVWYRIEQGFQYLILRRARDNSFALDSVKEGQLSFDGIPLRGNEDLHLGQKVLHQKISAHLSTSLPCSEEENDVSKIIGTKVCKCVLPFLYSREFGIEPPTNTIDGIGEAFIIDDFNPF
jgi:hypothetical protein